MSRFDECVQFVLKWEGGLDRDPNDPGGTTNFGIDQRDHPHVNVAALNREGAIEIYRSEKWDKMRCALMKEPWDLVVLDSSVNPGQGWTPSALQRAVNARVDGFIGPKTIDCVNSASTQMLINFLRARCVYYRNRPEKLHGRVFRDRYIDGWLNRTSALAIAAFSDKANVDRVMIIA